MARIQPFAQVERVDYQGREFADFYPARNKAGRGYVVMGRCIDPSWYGGKLVKVCVTWIKRYKDGRAFHVGFERERDAHQFALYLNGTDLGSIK